MNEQLQNENRSALVGIASAIVFPYLWLGLFVFLAWLYNIGFFGHELGSVIVPGLLCLALLTPVIPATLTKFVIRPVFSNLLGREIIAAPGCITGLVSIVLAGFATLYFLSRGEFDVAGKLLLAAPLVGALLVGGVTLLLRAGGLRLSSGRRAAPASSIRVQKPATPALPGARKPPMLSAPDRPALPTTSSRPSNVPATRRNTESTTPSRPPTRSQPPTRRKP